MLSHGKYYSFKILLHGSSTDSGNVTKLKYVSI